MTSEYVLFFTASLADIQAMYEYLASQVPRRASWNRIHDYITSNVDVELAGQIHAFLFLDALVDRNHSSIADCLSVPIAIKIVDPVVDKKFVAYIKEHSGGEVFQQLRQGILDSDNKELSPNTQRFRITFELSYYNDLTAILEVVDESELDAECDDSEEWPDVIGDSE